MQQSVSLQSYFISSVLFRAAQDPWAEQPRLSVFGVVRRLREQRYCMVQANTQYEFIYQYIN
jgi:protein tyrosine phosphatase